MDYDYAMISKIEKAKAYSQDRERITFESFNVRIEGYNSSHKVKYENGSWQCDCSFFESRSICGHTMAMERVLDNMVEIGTDK